MERKYRIKTNVGEDKVLNVNLKQNIDLYEILSLNISKDNIDGLKRENSYKLFNSDYGVIVGRVLANDAFGVPNAKISVFVPISDKDKLRTDIKEIYPYSFVTDYNKENIRYNTLPNYQVNECHTPVGTFPSKRFVLDNDSVIEIYDKYYKYTTVTNDAGDYMIFGVPVGNQIVHTDVDLSDIGILSQHPYDFISKGYTETMFDGYAKFKKSTNLDNLVQIISDNSSVTVYPFWGDSDVNEIAITRKDIQLQYKFETTCVFFGSTITDSSVNSISHKCVPDLNIGDASQLTSIDGKIEIIRKTYDDGVEEYRINDNNLIDENGVFCFQIPMNLDFIGTDEYGNIIPTNDIKKGIATRARVRFRFTLNENIDDGTTAHKARFLVPNNPELVVQTEVKETSDTLHPRVKKSVLYEDNDNYYKFGTDTPDECFRDLYWNKIYSVKGYIPRIQVNGPFEREQNYLGLKGVNKKGARSINPIPYNKINLNFSVPAMTMLKYLDNDKSFWRKYWDYVRGSYNHYRYDSVRERMVEDLDAIGLDFYNDWLNGCLYFPNWSLISGDIKDEEENNFCDCDKNNFAVYLTNSGSLPYYSTTKSFDYKALEHDDDFYDDPAHLFGGNQLLSGGVIKRIINKDNVNFYYYSFGNPVFPDLSIKDTRKIARLFATDLILLGSLTDNDFQGIPKMIKSIPSTTCNMPPIGIYKNLHNDGDDGDDKGIEGYDEVIESSNISQNGMNWGSYWSKGIDEIFPDDKTKFPKDALFNLYCRTGLFFGIYESTRVRYGLRYFPYFKVKERIIRANSNEKTCQNVERICELGVSIDSNVRYNINDKYVDCVMDGFITKNEIFDSESRSFFATLNSSTLIGTKYDKKTGYYKYNLSYLYPNNFDGSLQSVTELYLNKAGFETTKITDYKSKDYIEFRFKNYHNKETDGYNNFYGYIYDIRRFVFPLYENSFYFYFGINPENTAIDRVYNTYLQDCSSPVKHSPFDFYTNIVSTDFCDNKSTIKITVNGRITYPYSIEITNDTTDGYHISGINTNEVSIKVENGDYLLTIIDSKGYYSTTNLNISIPPISINCTKLSEIKSTLTDCTNNINNCGEISIDSVSNNNENYKIETFEYIEKGANTLKFKINNKYNLVISIDSNDDIDDYICFKTIGSRREYIYQTESGTNVLKILEGGTNFNFNVSYGCSDNESYTTIYMSNPNDNGYTIEISDKNIDCSGGTATFTAK